MKTARLVVSLVALIFLCLPASATSFAVLLGGPGDDKKSGDEKSEAWIEIGGITWTKPASKSPATVAAPASGTPDRKPGAIRAYEPVVLTVPAGDRPAALKKAFKKGRKLGTIHLRDGNRVLVLHDVVVGGVTRSGDVESISLNYSKIENANVPERARARMEGDPDRPVVTGRGAGAPPAKEKAPR